MWILLTGFGCFSATLCGSEFSCRKTAAPSFIPFWMVSKASCVDTTEVYKVSTSCVVYYTRLIELRSSHFRFVIEIFVFCYLSSWFIAQRQTLNIGQCALPRATFGNPSITLSASFLILFLSFFHIFLFF